MAWSDCLSEELYSSISQVSVCSPSLGIPSMSSDAASTAVVEVPSETRDDNLNQSGQGPSQTTVGPTTYSLSHNLQAPSNSNLVVLSNSPKPFIQPPLHGLSAATGPSFSYNIPNAGICLPSEQQLQSSTNSSADVVQETSFPLSTSAQPISSLVQGASSSSLVISPLPKIVTTGFQNSVVSSYHVPQAMATTPQTPGPPGISSSVPLKPNVNALPTSIFPSHSSIHQGYASYPSIAPVVAPSHEMWFPSPQGGLPRPPLYPYSTAPLPGPYVFQHPGISLSAPLPDMRPVGNTSMGTSGGIPIPSGAQFATSSVLLQDVSPVTDEKLMSNVSKDGSTITEELNAWTAHRTEAGAVYYYNALTGESTYGKPAGFKGEPEKVTAQTTPVSWEKLSGTDWALVITNDGKKYYHNTKTQLSSWQIPHELTELSRKQASDIVMEESISLPNNSVVTGKESPVSLSAPAIHSGGRDATSLRSSNVSASSALDLIKKKLQDSVVPATSSPVLPLLGSVSSETNGLKAIETASKGHLSDNNKEKHGAFEEGNISESSSDSEDNESGPTKEECVIQFKEMLKERSVAPFSKWEKELPKIVFDPRFKAIPNYNTRRSLFEHYVRTRAEEERKEKRAAQRAAIDGFKQLLEEAKEDINLNTNYQIFRKKWGNDPRFEALDRKDRESLLNERVLSLRKAAEQKAIALRAAVSFGFKAMLKEKGDINTTSRWSKVKDDLKDDPRCKSINREDREILFNEFLSELKAAEEEVSRASKAKYEEHEKLKEREREMRKRKEREEQEVERVRSKARRKEAIESYHALLVETLKDPKATWTESKPKLDKDPQGRSSNPYLDSSDLEKLFREHVKILHERCMNDFRALLAETVTPEAGGQVGEDGKTVLNSWSTAKRLMKSDPRYVKAPRKDRELLWQRHVDEIQRKKKSSGPDEEEEKNGTESKGRSLDTGKNIAGRRIQQRI